MFNALLIITVLVNGEPQFSQSFPMATMEECASEVEWPGNAVRYLMDYGTGYEATCQPALPEGVIST